MEALWAKHLEAEFVTKDVQATMATMVDNPSVDHVPVHTGGVGVAALHAFYRDTFIPSWPDDLRMQPLNRVVGENQIVDEIRISFTHTRQMDWLVPGAAATGKPLTFDLVVVVQFREGKIAAERIYWDQLGVLRQLGLLQREASA